ncbi:MAG: hypothetical protein JXA06_04870 [Bacteroidetes bacterium]|nr:hypothetical protein [Bacteroidota bacterium]
MKTKIIIGAVAAILIAGGLWYFLTQSELADTVAFPYIAHQKPAIDPHLPSSTAMADKLDDVMFDGLFNLTATPSGVIFENGLGEFIGINGDIVTIRLKSGCYWHDSYQAFIDDEDVTLQEKKMHEFTAKDLAFTLKRIQSLGSLSPDYILVGQALPVMEFVGPNERNEISFRFRENRLWIESDIKEVLSFKILPDNSDMNALTYSVGTTPYMKVPDYENIIRFYATQSGGASIGKVHLVPYVDNSTFTTELRNENINVLLETPFGSLSPILQEQDDFFAKSNVSSTFFAVLFNTQRLNRDQRIELRRLLNNKEIVNRFFKVGTEQQRHIIDFKGNYDNYTELLNDIVFPTSSYYVQEKIVERVRDENFPNLSILPDTVRIKACLNYGYREEYSDLIEILNDRAITQGKVKATAVQNSDIKQGDYDAVLVAISGYRSNFLFDLYSIFLREPDLETYKVNLQTTMNEKGELVVNPASFKENRNFLNLDPAVNAAERNDIILFLDDMYNFMSTHHVGDKQEYARRVAADENKMALGAWFFSLPSTAYFSTQFDSTSIDLYGVASQLSTLKKWKESQN